MAKHNAALSLIQPEELPQIERKPTRNPSKKLTVRLTPQDYRHFSDLCKVEAGKVLEISTFEAMDNSWGRWDCTAWEAIEDVREKNLMYTRPVSRIELAESVDVAEFRRVGRSRDELDWSALEDKEIYPFIVWHEIGHCLDNFCMLEAAFKRDGVPDDVRAMVRPLNEILADRFAWSKVRPGEPMPLTAKGKSVKSVIEVALTYVNSFFQRAQYPVRPLVPGQYTHVSPRMLENKKLAAFVGPDVHPELLAYHIWKHANPLDYRAHIARQNAENPRPIPSFDPSLAKGRAA
jgi:hypothetical protein